MTQTYRAVLFDMDGTLLEPSIDFRALRERLGVPLSADILDWVFEQPPTQRERLNSILLEVEIEAAERSALLPRARETLEWLTDKGIRHGILTRNSQEAWDRIRVRCDLRGIGDVFTREGGPAKPDPACLAPILRRWSVEASKIVHVGDYLYDLQLARVTGMHSILIHSSGANPYPEPSDFIARDHGELLEYLKRLFP
ncbi:MAG: HAD family hydrolase [Candidatus Omnitrophica bacterium]|nr:Phosphoglycolate phosphatase [bacterium]NUN97268.1 HAD family hydrolase [Candidatus Omnitrophota bacterium]